jgi:ketosteroid isomerase-like protein
VSKATIARFYAAFAKLDAETMAACYAPDAELEDEAFTLHGAREVGGMWRMLCAATKAKPASLAHWHLAVSAITERSAHWEAHYLFSATGRAVVNRIDAAFEFNAQGLITKHRDQFNFWVWSRQALGAPGWLLGWTPFLRAKVRKTAAANLQRFLAAR